MKRFTPALLLLATLGVTSGARTPDPDASQSPEWPLSYSVQGQIVIPFAEIEEPFQAFYDEAKGKSRIDYYGGMDKTFQMAKDGDSGTLYKIVPESTQVMERYL